jgi:hypothetical protein
MLGGHFLGGIGPVRETEWNEGHQKCWSGRKEWGMRGNGLKNKKGKKYIKRG